MEKYDFSGWATRNDLKCSDGRIIRKDAFKHNDGMTVPLVWNHDHTDPYRVIGHALLENRDEGVYAYGSFNDTELGRQAKVYVEHGDITAMSIYANQLQQQGPNVMHGSIREVSLVLAGANPGAYIENVIKHGDEPDSEEARIYTGLEFELYHAESTAKNEEEKPKKGEEPMAEETKKDESKETETKETSKQKTIGEIIDAMTEEQKNAVYALVGQVAEDMKGETGDDMEDEMEDEMDDEKSKGGKKTMKHNVFDNEERQEETLSHSEMTAILEDAKRCGTLKEAVLQHGIEQIDVLFPDSQNIANEPEMIKRDDTWVTEVLGAVHHTPFSRIKTVMADITADEARARGYVKGNLKMEEVFKLLKRITNPTTVYKKQKLDRDDVLDIKDFNILPWMKSELRMMLNEELARAILVGDGRTELSEDKIKEDCIRPIWTDADLFTVKYAVEVSSTETAEDKAKAFIKGCVKSRKEYKGTGNPIMFMPEDILTDCLLIEDKNGRIIYDTIEKLAAALRVRKIVAVPVMEDLSRTVGEKVHTLAGIYVNPSDYNVGTDKGGEVNMFDDFDIDYNQMKYLIETRCSGALTKPFAAVALEFVPANAG